MKPKIKATCTKLQLQLLSFCLLCLSGKTRCDGNGSTVITVEQNSVAVLPCSLSTKENIELYHFDWKKAAQKDGRQKDVFYYDAGIHSNNGHPGQSEEFKGRVSHFQEGLTQGNASIIIRNTAVSDSGNYTCDFPDLQPRQTFHIELVVGTCPKPNLRILAPTKDGMLLQCEVKGASPIPKVEWKDSSGEILPAEELVVLPGGGLYEIILRATVTKSDNYSCVSTQEEICHQMFDYDYVPVNSPTVVTVEENSDAVLPCSLSTKENIEPYHFDWKKAAQKDGRQKEVFYYDAGITYDNGRPGQSEEFKGRVSHFQEGLTQGNATIIITNTAVSDSGNYICDFPDLQPRQMFHIELVVEPVVVRVKQDEDAVLPCFRSTKNIEQGHFDWNKVAQNNEEQKEVFRYEKGRHSNSTRPIGSQDDGFKGRVLHFQEELKQGNASIIIRKTKRTDNGTYTCTTFTEPRQTFHIELVVDCVLKDRRDENIPGKCPKPNLKILGPAEDGMLLHCEVRGAFPKPKVELKDSSGKILDAEESQVTDRGGLYDIILRATVTKTDNYICVSTQEEICHQNFDDTYVPVIGPTVVTVEQNSVAVLPCSLSTKENIESYHFDWKKAAQKDGRQKDVFYYDAGITYDSGHPGQSEEFKGRVSHFEEGLTQGNASIIIRNTAVSDSGNYICDFPDLQPRQTFHIKLVVEPVVVRVKQDEDALLPCFRSTKNIEQGHFDWNKVAQNNEEQKEVFRYEKGRHSNSTRPIGSQDDGFKGRVLHFQEELKQGNASIIIRKTKMTDSGDYTCTFTESLQTFHIDLVVVCGLKDRTDENIPGTCPKPNLRILRPTKDAMLLQCEVKGASPIPKVELKDSSGKILPAEDPVVLPGGGLYEIILRATVTKTDNYICVSTQEEICHQISADTYVPVIGNDGSGANSSGSSTGLIVGAVLGVILFVLGVAFSVLVHKGYIPRKCNKGSPADQNDSSGVPLKSQPSQSQDAPVTEASLSLHVL